MADDAAPDRRVHGRRLRLRGCAPRQRRDHQRGRDRVAARRAPPTASAQVYVGIFSPSRGTLPGPRARRGAAVVADQATSSTARERSTQLDLLQGDPARVRDLAVGFGSLRTIRAETPVSVPLDRDRPAPGGRPAQGHHHEPLDRAPRAPGGRPRRDRGDVQGPRARWRRHRRRPDPEQPVRAIAVRQGRRPGLLRRRPAECRHRGALHPPLDGRPADLRPDVRVDRAARHRGPGRAGLGLARPPRDRDRGPDAAPPRQRPLLPARPDVGQRGDDLPLRPDPLERGRVGRAVLQQGPVQHQLRPGLGDDRLPADDVRWHARGDRARDRSQLRGRYSGRP